MNPSTTTPHVNSMKETLKCVCIPDDGSPAYLCTLPLSEVDSENLTEEECNFIERQLKRIPNMKDLHDPFGFSWEKRQLHVGMERNFDRESLDADYYLYTCMDASSGLSRNSYLERIQEGLPADKRVKIHGIAILFKSTEYDIYGRGKYIDMTQEFVEGLEAGDSPERDILRGALMEPQEMEWRDLVEGGAKIYYKTAGKVSELFVTD